MIKNTKYIEEIRLLKEKMNKAEAWGEKMPIFHDEIIERKITGEEVVLEYSKRYKKAYFAWGIKRIFYASNSKRTITNCKEDYSQYFWSVYINTFSIYDSHNKYGLEEVLAATELFFFDELNTTIYATDEQIEKVLDVLAEWYHSALEKAKKDKNKNRVEELKKELKKLK